MKKRILSTILVLCLIVTLLPMSVLAAEISTTIISEDTTWSEANTLTGDLTVNSGATLTIGAQVTISGNVTISGGGTIKRGSGYNGILLYAENSTLMLSNITIDGGSVWGNKNTENNKDTVLNRGTTNSGVTANNSSNTSAALIRSVKSTITLSTGAILQNNSVAVGAAAIDGSGSTITISGGTIQNNYGQNGIVTVNNGSTGINSNVVMIGGMICGNETETYASGVNLWAGCSVELSGGTICHGYSTASNGNGAGGILIGNNASGTMSGTAVITNNYAGSHGGGVQAKGPFTMSGGTIKDNVAGMDGGGIYVWYQDAAVCTITGGTISGNSAREGGGISVGSKYGGTSEHPEWSQRGGHLIMSGGTVTGNTAFGEQKNRGEWSFGGGGIFVSGTAAISGGSVTGNKTSYTENYTDDTAAGIYILSSGKLTLSGSPVICDNTRRDNSKFDINTSIDTNTKAAVSVNGALSSAASVHFNSNDTDFVVTGEDSYVITEADTAAFKNDAEGYLFYLTSENQIKIAAAKTVTFHANYDNSSETTTQQVPIGVATSLDSNAFIRTGHTFSGWSTQQGGGDTAYADKAAITTSDNVDLYAQWTPNQYNITYELNGGTAGTNPPSMHTYGTATTLIAPTKTGYTFGGWYTDSNLTNQVASLEANGYTDNITLYAKWTPNTYTINFSGGTGATGETTSVRATYDQPATLTANGFTMANKNFAGWDTDSSANNIVYADGGEVENLTTEANGTVTLYAVWTDKTVLDLNKTVQTYPYDGQAKAFAAEGFTVSYKMGNTVIDTPVDAGTYDVVISAVETDDTAAYPETTITGGLVIEKAELTITADNKSIYVGDTLPAYTYTVTGWKGEDENQAEELLSGIEIGCPEADASTVGTYTISMTGPESISNYTLSYENGTLTVSRRSSGGGGSSNTTTTTTKNDDGSTTTTTTNKTAGTVTETTKNTDGSTETVETKKDGTVTTTTKAADGSSAKVVENADGTTEIEASASKAAVREAEKSGTPVALPLEVAASENASDAPDVEVSLPAADGTVAVSINVKNITPGTVAMLIGDDGTTEVIRKSVADDDEIVIPLDGSATVKIVNNEKAFTDTDNHWAEGAIDFVTARELYAGTSATTFSPDNTMTRAMLARVLHNLESNPDHAFDGTFSDVNAHWAADSIHWAAERGIVGGYPNGSFGADNNITREQLAVMLWRYAGSPESSHDLSHFNDAANISSYAKVALAWANEHGIVGGVGNNTMNPQGNATRAQVATMLMRMMQNTF